MIDIEYISIAAYYLFITIGSLYIIERVVNFAIRLPQIYKEVKDELSIKHMNERNERNALVSEQLRKICDDTVKKHNEELLTS